MPVRIHNTLTRKKEEFVPLYPGEVRIYVCGVTVYDVAHVGHARSAIVFDVIRRYLRFKGCSVRFVKNFTDVDDKIIKRAHEAGVPPRELAEQYIEEYRKDMAALGVEAPDVEPKATEYIPQMIRLIERLLIQGFAYRVNGDVYFEVRRFGRYGRLSGKNLEELRAGARVEVDERKRDPLDFALWKSSKPDEPAWESPWGPGRPGWHIECSAMSMHYLGESFDIHGGGEDLIFPHHENEIAQSEAATGKPFVRYWIHNAFVKWGKEKMSKSLGNIVLIKELLEHHHEDHLRYYLLGTHYRNPVEFWNARVDEAGRGVGRLRNLIKDAFGLAKARQVGMGDPEEHEITERSVQQILQKVSGDELRREMEVCCTKFTEAMDDDFNTPQARAVLFDLHHALNRYRDGGRPVPDFVRGAEILLRLGRALGLFWRHVNPDKPSAEETARINEADEINESIFQRDQARARRDWKLADELRDRILREHDVIIEDAPTGTRWRWRGE